MSAPIHEEHPNQTSHSSKFFLSSLGIIPMAIISSPQYLLKYRLVDRRVLSIVGCYLYHLQQVLDSSMLERHPSRPNHLWRTKCLTNSTSDNQTPQRRRRRHTRWSLYDLKIPTTNRHSSHWRCRWRRSPWFDIPSTHWQNSNEGTNYSDARASESQGPFSQGQCSRTCWRLHRWDKSWNSARILKIDWVNGHFHRFLLAPRMATMATWGGKEVTDKMKGELCYSFFLDRNIELDVSHWCGKS